MNTWTAVMVLILAIADATLSLRYCIINHWRKRSKLRFIHFLAAVYIAGVYILSISQAVTMQDIAGPLFRLGIALLLAAGLAGAIIDQ